jgi:hypothetical protein
MNHGKILDRVAVSKAGARPNRLVKLLGGDLASGVNKAATVAGVSASDPEPAVGEQPDIRV